MACCRPLGFLIGLPFALLSLSLSFVGSLLFIFLILSCILVGFDPILINVCMVFDDLGRSLLSCICPCCVCVAILISFSISLVKLPINIIIWFTDMIPF
ncbi:hypothetical protein SDJN02_05084, partial [Cucurbita argyrosperma subsp. argyrosperma]